MRQKPVKKKVLIRDCRARGFWKRMDEAETYSLRVHRVICCSRSEDRPDRRKTRQKAGQSMSDRVMARIKPSVLVSCKGGLPCAMVNLAQVRFLCCE